MANEWLISLVGVAAVAAGVFAGLLWRRWRTTATVASFRAAAEVASQRSQQAIIAYEVAREKLKDAERREAATSAALAALREENARARETRASLEERLSAQKQLIEELRPRLEAEFRSLADQILEDKSAQFTELNRANLDLLLKPLGESIEAFRKRVEDVYSQESKERFSLRYEVERLVQLNQRVSQEASNLTSALKGNAKTQGDWGQVILESILEKSGLARDREYFIQQTLRDSAGRTLADEEGRRMQPDVVVRLPGNRHVIIDSKVSLTAYERFVNTTDERERMAALEQHLRSVRRHVDELAAKSYTEHAGALDSVIMFIPTEGAYITAIQNDQELWDYAFPRRVLVLSATNLIAVLRVIADLWKRERQTENVAEIAKRGGALYDKLVSFVDTLGDLGAHIDKAEDAYRRAMSQLATGNGNLLKKAERLRELGAPVKKALPRELLGADEDEEDAGAGLPVLAAREGSVPD
jgi:DNA recombination protein RmuC